jgi:hypothetical protein
MRRNEINYDTGFSPAANRLSREHFNPLQVRREIEIIARDLHCTAIRISGQDPRRIALASESALRMGLEVWFAPFPCNMTHDELVPYFASCAELAEELRKQSSRVVFVLGCEMSLANSGFVPGANFYERIGNLLNPQMIDPVQPMSSVDLENQFNVFLDRAVSAVKSNFAGPVTYASGPWENVDWSNFDFVGVDLYKDAKNRTSHREKLRTYFSYDRPVVVTEFGCCTYRGAPDRGSMGWAIVDLTTQPPRLTEDVVRDEQAQAEHLTEMLSLLEDEGVDGAFWFTFAGYRNPYHESPRYDLDCVSYGIVIILDGTTGEVYPGMPWEPKQSFYALASSYVHSS